MGWRWYLLPFRHCSKTIADAGRTSKGETYLQWHLRLPQEDRCRGGHRRRCLQGIRRQRFQIRRSRFGARALRPIQEVPRSLSDFFSSLSETTATAIMAQLATLNIACQQIEEIK